MSQLLNQAQIQGGVKQSLQPLRIELLEEVSSTNDVAKELLKEHPNDFILVATNKQTAGRGRQGKSFYSELAHGLYFTLGFQPKNLQIEEIPFYTILAAAALVEVLEQYVKHPLAIKWVNDIFYQGRKISGILSEMTTADEIGIVVGIGINFAGDFSETDESVQAVAGTLFGPKSPETFNQNEFLSAYLNQFQKYHEDLKGKAFMPVYEKHLLGIGQEVYYFVKEVKKQGVIEGINEQGHLLIRRPDQRLDTLYGQEVHFSSAQFIQ